MPDSSMARHYEGDWIDVQDRLPADSEFVLVVVRSADPGGTMIREGRIRSHQWYGTVFADRAGFVMHDVIYWTPIPKAPSYPGASRIAAAESTSLRK